MITTKELAKYLEKSDLFKDIYEKITFGNTPEDKRLTLARFVLGIPESPRTRTKKNKETAKHGLEEFYLEERPEFHPELTEQDYERYFDKTFEHWASEMPGRTIQERIEQAKEYLARQISAFNSRKYKNLFSENTAEKSLEELAA